MRAPTVDTCADPSISLLPAASSKARLLLPCTIVCTFIVLISNRRATKMNERTSELVLALTALMAAALVVTLTRKRPPSED